LLAGESIVLVKDPLAFAARYLQPGSPYTNIKLAPGEYGASSLSNGGEEIRVIAADATPIQTFTYDDAGLWVTLPDGGGPSLTPIQLNPSLYNDPTNWRTSYVLHGTPGLAEDSPPVAAQVYYKGSTFASSSVPAALDPIKRPLQPGITSRTTTFTNVSSYTRGLNGLVLDVAGLVGSNLTSADFIFRMAPAGTSGAVTPANWPTAPVPTSINITSASPLAPARVRLEWANNAIQDTWLQVIVKANNNTGLTVPQVFYLGSAVGEVNGAAPYRVTGADLSAVLAAVSTSTVSINDARDVDKSGRVSGSDLSVVLSRSATTIRLNNITIPIAGSAEEGATLAGGGGAVLTAGTGLAGSSTPGSPAAKPPVARPALYDAALLAGPGMLTPALSSGSLLGVLQPYPLTPTTQGPSLNWSLKPASTATSTPVSFISPLASVSRLAFQPTRVDQVISLGHDSASRATIGSLQPINVDQVFATLGSTSRPEVSRLAARG